MLPKTCPHCDADLAVTPEQDAILQANPSKRIRCAQCGHSANPYPRTGEEAQQRALASLKRHIKRTYGRLGADTCRLFWSAIQGDPDAYHQLWQTQVEPQADLLCELSDLMAQGVPPRLSTLSAYRGAALLSPTFHRLVSDAMECAGRPYAHSRDELALSHICTSMMFGAGDGSYERPYLATLVHDQYELFRSARRCLGYELFQLERACLRDDEGDRYLDWHAIEGGGEVWFDVTALVSYRLLQQAA